MASKIKAITMGAVMAALVVVATMIRIPTPTGGHVNLGDTVIFVSAMFFQNPFVVFFIGAFGSALADLLGGHFPFVLGTFFIKGTEGIVLYLILKVGKKPVFRLVGCIAASAVMVLGYYLYEVYALGFAVPLALSVVVPNFLQAAVCSALSLIIVKMTEKRKSFVK